MERKRKTEEKKSKEMEEVKKAPKRKTLVKATITKRPSKYQLIPFIFLSIFFFTNAYFSLQNYNGYVIATAGKLVNPVEINKSTAFTSTKTGGFKDYNLDEFDNKIKTQKEERKKKKMRRELKYEEIQGRNDSKPHTNL